MMNAQAQTKGFHLVYKWLAVAAVADWLITRTVTRAAIHMPKSPGMIAAYTAVNQAGLVAAAFVSLLALALLSWIAWQTRPSRWLPVTLAGLAGLSLLFLVIVPSAGLALAYQLLAVTAVLLIVTLRSGEHRQGWLRGQAVCLLPAVVLLLGLLYQLLPSLYTVMGWSGPPPFTITLFNLGELLIVVCVAVWWWVYGRTADWRLWLIAAVPALLFTLSFQRDPAMTGILTIWSTGLTLFLPWPIYALALWLAGVTVLAAWHEEPSAAYAILLFAAAGYAPQLSSQLFCALIGLWLWKRPLPIIPANSAISHSQVALPLPSRSQ